MRLLLALCILNSGKCFTQAVPDSINTRYKNPYPAVVPHMHSTHPLGVYISETNFNHQSGVSRKASFSMNTSCGNVWLPYVKGYIPLNETDKKSMSRIVWHGREGNIDLANTPAKTKSFHADGDIRFYQCQLAIPVSKSSELKISTRAFSVHRGGNPVSFLTSDKFIEWFHSNIAGGEDPFARKVYGYNHADIRYTDENGKSFSLGNGDFRFTGLDLSYFYFPHFKSLEKKKIFINWGFQTGLNTSKINPCINLGLNSTINKLFKIGKDKQLDLSISAGALRQKAVSLGDGVNIASKKYLYNAEILLSYQKQLSENRFFAIGSSYFIHSAYNKKDEFKTIILTGERISSHWHYALSHLYRTLTYNTLFMSYTVGKLSFSIYVKEDLLVDNAPDVQTGVGINVNL